MDSLLSLSTINMFIQHYITALCVPDVDNQTKHIEVIMHPSFRVAHKPLISFIGKRKWPPGDFTDSSQCLFSCLTYFLQGHNLNYPTLLRQRSSKRHSLTFWRNTRISHFHRPIRAMGRAQESRYSTSSGRLQSIFGNQRSEI